jgi:o-succinylbenzoate synthase
VTIDRLDIRLLRLPLVRYFETSFARSYDRMFVLVTVHGDGAQGWGEAVAEHDPYYSSETTETVWHVVTEFLAPLVLGREFAHPRDLWPAMARVRGHHMAKAVIEMAAWDLHAKQNGQPLWQALGGRRRPIASGVSIGIQDSLDELLDRVTIEREAGYQRIKIKIKPGWDVEAVERLRARFGAIPLMVDANAAYTLGDAAHLSALDRFDLMMIEQPLDYDDVMDHARLQRQLRTAVCLTSRSCRRGSRPWPSKPAPAASSTSAGPRRRARGVDSSARHLARRGRPRLAWRHAGVGHRPGTQSAPVDAPQLPSARRYRSEQALLRRGSDRPGDRRSTRWHGAPA